MFSPKKINQLAQQFRDLVHNLLPDNDYQSVQDLADSMMDVLQDDLDHADDVQSFTDVFPLREDVNTPFGRCRLKAGEDFLLFLPRAQTVRSSQTRLKPFDPQG